MAAEIEARIGIDGESEFKSSLGAITQQLRTLGSELKAVTAEFQDNENSMEALSAQNDVLTRSIDAGERKIKLLTAQYERQTAKLNELSESLDQAAKEFGETSEQAAKAQNAYNKQYQEVSNLENQINKTRTALANMRSQLQKTEREMDDLGDTTDDAADAMDDLDGVSGGLVNGLADLKAGFDMVGGVITSVISGAMDLVTSFFELAEATEEYRTAQGLLNTAFETAGYSTSTAKQAYKDLYAIIGDTDTATEAAQQLSALAKSQESLVEWQRIGAGVAGVFGAALPLNNLYEAANETSRAGVLTGQLVDAILRANIAEDDFNAALARCTTETDRNQLIMETLSSTYDTAADAFYRNNAQLVEARNNQVAMDDAMAQLGRTVQDVKNQIQSDFTPALSDVVTAFSDVVAGAEGSKEKLSQAIGSLISDLDEKIPEYNAVGAEIMEAIGAGVIDNSDALLSALEESYDSNMEQAGDLGKKSFKKLGEIWAESLSGGFDLTIGQFFDELSTSLSGPFSLPYTVLKKAFGGDDDSGNDSSSSTIRPFVPENSTGSTQTFNFQVDLDGQTLARSSYDYSQREATLRGTSFVEVP